MGIYCFRDKQKAAQVYYFPFFLFICPHRQNFGRGTITTIWPYKQPTTIISSHFTVLYNRFVGRAGDLLLLSVFRLFRQFCQPHAGAAEYFLLRYPRRLLLQGWQVTCCLKRKVQDAVNMTSNSDKLNAYRAAFLTRCALL